MKQKIYKALSILLTIVMVLSCCMCAMGTVFAVEGNATYYVSETGDDEAGDGSQEAPFISIQKAIETANAAGYAENNEVTLNLMGEWVDLGDIPEYTFDLKILGIEENKTAIYSLADASFYANNPVGKTTFQNIEFLLDGNDYASFAMNDSKEIAILDPINEFGGTKYLALGSYADYDQPKSVAGQNVYIDFSVRTFYLGNCCWQNKTYTEDLNIVIDNEDAKPNFYFNPSATSSVTYEKNLNIELLESPRVEFKYMGNVTINGAIQVINSCQAPARAGNIVTSTDPGLADLTDCDMYFLNDNTGVEGILDFIPGVTGKFFVKEGKTVSATKGSATVTSAYSEEYGANVLDLTGEGFGAGDYEIAVVRTAQTFNYYVSANGDDANDGLTAGTALKTVGGVVAKANANADVAAMDKVVANVALGETVEWGSTEAYAYELTVQSSEALGATLSLPGGASTCFAGTTVIKNVSVPSVEQFMFGNQSVTFDEGTSFNATYPAAGNYVAYDSVAGQKIILRNSGWAPYEFKLNADYGGDRYLTDDLYVEVDNANANIGFAINASYSTTTYTENANLNLYLRQGSAWFNPLVGTLTHNGAIQVIVAANANFSKAENITSIAAAKGVYILKNATDVEDVVTFIPNTAGKFLVKEGETVTATKGGASVVSAFDEELGANVLDLTALGSGEYVITLGSNILEPVTDGNYFVSATGSDETGNGSEAAPVASIQKAVELAIAAGLGAGDEVTVKLTGETVTLGNIPAYDFDLNIKGIDETTTNVASTNTYTDAFANSSVGKTTIQNVTFANNTEFYLNHSKDVSLLNPMGKLSGQQYLTFGTYADNDQAKTVAGQNIYIGISVRFMNLGNSYWQNITYTEDVNITLDHEDAKPYFCLNPGYSNGAGETPKVKYEKNLNINSTKSPRIIFQTIGDATVDGAIQIINSSAANNGSGTRFSTADIALECDKYVLNNDTGIEDLLSFVPGVEGKFFVKSGSVTATKGDASVVSKYDAVSGEIVLDLTSLGSGDYEITLGGGEEPPVKETYEVGTGKTYTTITDAITAAVEAGLDADDSLTIKVTSDISWGTQHTPAHEFDLTITSDLEAAPTIALANDTYLGGNTTFGKVHITITVLYGQFFLGAYDVTFGPESSVYINTGYVIFGDSVNRDIAGQNVVIDGNINVYAVKVGGNMNTNYTDTLNITVNNPNMNLSLALGNNWGYISYHDVNIDVKSVNSLTLTQEAAGADSSCIDAGYSLTVMNRSGKAINHSNAKCLKDGNYWIFDILTNSPDFIIAKTNTLGTFNVTVPANATIQLKKPDASTTTVEAGAIEIPSGVSTFSVVRDPITEEYWVQSGATNGNGAIDAPFATIGEAVAKANESGELIKGDTVKVNVKGKDAVNWGTVPQHNFLLVVESADIATVKGSVSIPHFTVFSGDTAFYNIALVGSIYNSEGILAYGNHNVTFGEGTDCSAPRYTFFGEGATRDVESQTVIYKNAIGGWQIKIACDWFGVTYSGDVNVVVDNPNATPVFTLGGNYGQASNFNGNLNFEIISAASVSFNYLGGVPRINGALQVLNSASGVTISATANDLETVPANKKYIVNNISGALDLISYTDTVGKYAVNTEKYIDIVATNEEGDTFTPDENGFLNLPAGEYTLNCGKEAVRKTYYVKADATNGDGSYDKPFASVAEAVAAANAADMIKGDFLTVKVLGSKAVNWGYLDAYSFKLTVRSASPEKASINTTNGYSFTGDVDFKDIHLYYGSDAFQFNNKSMTFTEGASVGGTEYLQTGTPTTFTTVPAPSYVFECGLGFTEFKLGNDWNGSTYQGDFNVTFNHPDVRANVYLGANNGTTTFDTINFNIKNAGYVTVQKPWQEDSYYRINKGIQIINSCAPMAGNEEELAKIDASKKWILNNTSGNKDLLSFVKDELGKFAVDTDKYTVTATNGTNTYTAENGFLTIPAGVYTITAVAKATTEPVYYVQAGSDNGDGSQTAPFATVADAVNAAIAAGYTTDDTVEVNVLGDVAAQIGTLNAYKFTLVVKGGTVAIGDSIAANGKTVYESKLVGETLKVAGENVDLVIDNSRTTATVDFGTATYYNVSVNVKAAQSVAFTGTPVVTNAIQVAAGKADIIDANSKAVIDAINAPTGNWYVVGQVVFMGEPGVFSYSVNGEVEMVSGDATYAPRSAKFVLEPGEYTLNVKERGEVKYTDYIKDRGNGLANTAAKIANGEEVNVIYFGGSVTVGTGAGYTGGWRGLLGDWLVNTFPTANINNINAAYGGTSSRLGLYRLGKDVIAYNPDLVFIEFSINDYYDPVSKEVAALRFESIVRTLRTALPDCDIVTILVTEEAHIANNRNGGLHAQAQGHEDICIAYDIPSIHVGRALADTLTDDWASSRDWSNYAIDIVHLNDAGYTVYYNVIKEYFESELIYSDNDGKVKNHALPDIVNDPLMDGGIQYFDASSELIAQSEAMGGSDVGYSGYSYGYHTFAGRINLESSKSLFIFKFTGTELAAFTVAHSSGADTGFLVKVDDGGYQKMPFSDTKLEYIAQDLEPGEHTVYIKRAENSGSLWVGGFFVRDGSKATTRCAEHTYDNTCDADCNACGTTRVIKHTYDNCDDTECNICGETREAGAHEYDNCLDTDCNNCGAVREPLAHEYDDCEDTKCNVCGDVRVAPGHVYDNCEDTDCNNCGAVREPVEHEYDNCEDTQCNNCDATREALEHAYDDCEDAVCNNCGDTRVAPGHKYDNCEDTDCNNCGAVREALEHAYDNCEDTDCNNCGAVREALEHEYTADCDDSCNNCGYIREVEVDHEYDDATDADCNNCGAIRELRSGWVLEDGNWYYYENGAKKTGWLYNSNQWYYLNGEGVMVKGWLNLNGTWYYLDAVYGQMVKGWLRVNGTYYYLDTTYGHMVTGWLNLGGTWYYLKSNGAMATGWLRLGNTYYYLKASGAMATGWLNLGGTWYYLNASGAMATGWLQIGGTWYYLQGSGAMATGWLLIGGNWYYFYGSGAMAKNIYISGGYIDQYGIWRS